MSKHIVISGSTRGLGRAMVAEFVATGHRVSGCGRSAEAVAALQQDYPEHAFCTLDVTDTQAVGDWAASMAPPDLLINNAAIMNAPANLWEVPPEAFEQLTAVNINGVHHMIYAFVPRMIARGTGVVINFSSGWGRSSSRDVAPYCASKWAIEGLSEAMAQELPHGLGVVALNPGIINTDMLQTCWGEGADGFPNASRWAQSAVPYILSIGPEHNGQSLTCP